MPAGVPVYISDAFSVLIFVTDVGGGSGGSMSNFVGKAIRLSNWLGTVSSPSGGYRNAAGALYDPATPSLIHKLPGGNRTVVSGASLTKDAVGLYSLIVTPTVDGDAMAAFTSNDGAYSDPITFKVEPAPL